MISIYPTTKHLPDDVTKTAYQFLEVYIHTFLTFLFIVTWSIYKSTMKKPNYYNNLTIIIYLYNLI